MKRPAAYPQDDRPSRAAGADSLAPHIAAALKSWQSHELSLGGIDVHYRCTFCGWASAGGRNRSARFLATAHLPGFLEASQEISLRCDQLSRQCSLSYPTLAAHRLTKLFNDAIRLNEGIEWPRQESPEYPSKWDAVRRTPFSEWAEAAVAEWSMRHGYHAEYFIEFACVVGSITGDGLQLEKRITFKCFCRTRSLPEQSQVLTLNYQALIAHGLPIPHRMLGTLHRLIQQRDAFSPNARGARLYADATYEAKRCWRWRGPETQPPTAQSLVETIRSWRALHDTLPSASPSQATFDLSAIREHTLRRWQSISDKELRFAVTYDLEFLCTDRTPSGHKVITYRVVGHAGGGGGGHDRGAHAEETNTVRVSNITRECRGLPFPRKLLNDLKSQKPGRNGAAKRDPTKGMPESLDRASDDARASKKSRGAFVDECQAAVKVWWRQLPFFQGRLLEYQCQIYKEKPTGRLVVEKSVKADNIQRVTTKEVFIGNKEVISVFPEDAVRRLKAEISEDDDNEHMSQDSRIIRRVHGRERLQNAIIPNEAALRAADNCPLTIAPEEDPPDHPRACDSVATPTREPSNSSSQAMKCGDASLKQLPSDVKIIQLAKQDCEAPRADQTPNASDVDFQRSDDCESEVVEKSMEAKNAQQESTNEISTGNKEVIGVVPDDAGHKLKAVISEYDDVKHPSQDSRIIRRVHGHERLRNAVITYEDVVRTADGCPVTDALEEYPPDHPHALESVATSTREHSSSSSSKIECSDTLLKLLPSDVKIIQLAKQDCGAPSHDQAHDASDDDFQWSEDCETESDMDAL